MTYWKRLAGGAAITAMSLAIVQPAMAQQTTSSVRGSVEANGKAVANAVVSITHVPTGSKVETRTNEAGVFDARGLRVGGPYTVSVAAPSFAPQIVKDVTLALDDTARVDFTLQTVEVVTVEGRNVQVSSADVGSRTTLGRKEIATVVTTKRDLRDLTRRDPLVTLDNVTRGTGPTGGIYIAGSTPRLNRITIDGVKSHDDFGLNTGGLSTTRGPVSIDAIEQLTVQAVPFDVSEGDFTGGAVNLVLRGGGNTFHGSAFQNFQDQDLTGQKIRRAQAPITVDFSNYGGTLTGPIWKDRAFFAASYEYYSALDANAFNGPADLGFGSSAQINGLLGSAGPKLTTANLANVLAAYNSYAVSAKQPVGGFPRVTPTRDIKNSFRFDVNLTDNQRLQATYRHAGSTLYKVSGSATSISPISNWYIQGEVEDNYAVQLNSKWTDRLSTEARVAFRSYVRHQEPPQGQKFSLTTVCMDAVSSGDPFNCSNINSLTSSPTNTTPNGMPSFSVGPDQFRQANLLKTQNLSTDLTGTYTLQSHLLKAGFQSKAIDIFNVFVPQARGVYYFDSVADFAAGKVGSLQYQNNTSGDPTKAAANFSYNQSSLFAQDTWDLFDRKLTLNYGLRYDFYNSSDKPALNSALVARSGINNQTTYDGLDVLMPRLSFTYKPNRTWKVGGGVGLFSGGLPDVFLSNSFSNTGVLAYAVNLQRLGDGTFRDLVSGATVSSAVAAPLLTVNTATYGFGVPTSANALLDPTTLAARTAGTAFLAPDFSIPSDWKANLAFQYNAPWDIQLGLDIVGAVSNDSLAFKDVRARNLTINGKQQYTPDGRIRYDGLNITAANRALLGLPNPTNPDYTNLGSATDLEAYNPTTGSWSSTVALSASKSFDSLGLDVSFAYVYQDAENYGALSEFSTTPGGFYNDQFSSEDPNTATKGRSTNRIKDQYKLTMSWEHKFFANASTRMTLFAEARSGRPFSFLMTDPGSTRGSVFGVARGDQLLYVPDVNNPDASNALKFVSPNVNSNTGAPVTVFFDSATTLNNFKNSVGRFGLPVNTIVGKNTGVNPDVNQIDFQFAQEIPAYLFEGHKLIFTADVKNLLNLLNNKWGVVKEFTDSRGGSGNRLVSVQCADPATGVAIPNSSAACSAYRYSSFNSNPGAPGSNNPTVDTSSRWYVQLGLKYQF